MSSRPSSTTRWLSGAKSRDLQSLCRIGCVVGGVVSLVRRCGQRLTYTSCSPMPQAMTIIKDIEDRMNGKGNNSKVPPLSIAGQVHLLIQVCVMWLMWTRVCVCVCVCACATPAICIYSRSGVSRFLYVHLRMLPVWTTSARCMLDGQLIFDYTLTFFQFNQYISSIL